NLKSYPRFTAYTEKLSSMNLNIHSVDDKKVTDHHALLITENRPGKLSSDEQTIYEMIAGRMLEAFSLTCVKDITTLILSVDTILYETKGSVTKIAGWREVFNEQEEDGEDKTELPELSEGETLSIKKLDLLTKQTQPKPLHTEASLLSAMQTAGKELENEEQRLALKGCGIGTPATRAAIIETLFSRDYIRRDKKSLVPTEKGLAVYDVVKDKRIANVEMTGMWEDTFLKIESGEVPAGNFKKGIEEYAGQITKELLDTSFSLPGGETVCCPKCGIAPVNFYPKVVKCADPGCDLILFTSLYGKTLPNDVMHVLLSGKQTDIIKGFKGKTGKTFHAALKLDENFRIKFEFS
ncbi:DNA topoisomerase 3, partial [termite gut metagenome]